MARKDEKLAKESRVAYEKWRTYFKQNIDQYNRMMTFVLGRQWTDDEEDTFKTFRKIPMQFNKLRVIINALLGEQQQNTPQLEIYPLSMCDEETASLRQTIVKDIMLSTDAKTCYQVAAMQAAVGGFGAFMVDRDYVSDSSFDQDFIYRYFKDPTLVYWDQGADDINKIDGMHCGYIYRMTKDKFRAKVGKELANEILGDNEISASKEEVALATEPDSNIDAFTWADDDTVAVNRFIKRQFKPETLYKLSNGRVLQQKEMDELVEQSKAIQEEMRAQQMLLGELSGIESGMEQLLAPADGADMDVEDERVTLYDDGEPVRIIDSRKIKKSVIKEYEVVGNWIIEESEVPSEDLPIIFVDQNSYTQKDGKQITCPFIIDAVDTQRYLNYLGTQSAYILKVARYDQFMGSKKNVQSNDTQRAWSDPYTVYGLLPYDESPGGHKPERIQPPELSVSLTQQYQRAMEDLYTCTGMYPTRMGEAGNETSGAAIDARTRQGSYQTFVFYNSINRSICAGGKILNQMIPRVYDSERIITLKNSDEGRKNILINQAEDDYSNRIKNDLRKGTFAVELKAGPSYEGQKEQALQSLQLLLQADPTLLKFFADLYAENLPLSNTIEIRNRLKTIVPPEIIEAGKTGKMPQPQQQQPTPEERAVQIDEQYKQAQIQLKQQELAIKEKEMQADIAIERMKLEIAEIEMTGNIEEQRMRYLAQQDRTASDNAIAHADNLVKILTHRV